MNIHLQDSILLQGFYASGGYRNHLSSVTSCYISPSLKGKKKESNRVRDRDVNTGLSFSHSAFHFLPSFPISTMSYIWKSCCWQVRNRQYPTTVHGHVYFVLKKNMHAPTGTCRETNLLLHMRHSTAPTAVWVPLLRCSPLIVKGQDSPRHLVFMIPLLQNSVILINLAVGVGECHALVKNNFSCLITISTNLPCLPLDMESLYMFLFF